ncbi:DNA primase large subunit-like [Cimex lectularius]|uniref:DNA primase large subunit n=1 Tax=Cimex lectularius TaxID=79782 RepID=A0A8I6RSW6_CIMLE|nr:DNA primase large subunit-like [Cimex lectularius]
MDFRRVVSRKSIIKPVDKEISELYPHDLSLYELPPIFEVTFAELEQSAAERLAVLQTIDEVSSRGLKGDEWRKAITDDLKKQGLRAFCKLITSTSLGSAEADFSQRRRDHISHFILRLAYCETEDKRRWFISKEVDLFKLRWMHLNSNSRNEFLKINNLNYEMVEEEEKKELVKLSDGMVTFSIDYFKVNFIFVSDLVRMRKVFLSKGIAYITHEDIISVVTSSFRSNLAQSLAYASRRIHNLCEDSRIQGIIKGAGKTEREVNYSVFEKKEKIQIGNLDALSKISFPLCMQRLHERIRTEHHLKHYARRQYILFLKGIGVTMDDVHKFWRTEFTKKMDAEKFEKSYAYFIRHSYGKEGKRANYSPLNCMQIINGSVSSGEFHGCPFKHLEPTALKKIVEKNGINFMGVEEIVNLAKKGHYQLACSSYFKHAHNSEEIVVNHPNYYFDESQMVLGNKIIKKEDKGSKQPVQPKGSSQNTNVQNQSVDVWEEMDIDFSTVVT